MKVLIVSNSDIKGGAARSSYRLHQGLQSIGFDSQMLVQEKHSDNKAVIGKGSGSGIGKVSSGLRLTLDKLPLKFYPHHQNGFSTHWLPSKVGSSVNKINPDIINLHWVSAGYLQIEEVAKFKKPIVWTLHDMWAFTGGCHYNQDCFNYKASCGSCPQLHSRKNNSTKNSDLSRWIWKRKAKAWKNLELTIVTPSQWLAKCAKESSLFKDKQVEIIPYGLDLSKYTKFDKQIARRLLNLPQDKKIILFGALKATSDGRKGLHHLQPALKKLSDSGSIENLELAIFGASKPENPVDFGFKSHYLGTLNDDLTLALAYSAADVFVAPSVQDNLPNTVMEAIACGTPCVAFDIGGMPDMIEHQQNGYLAQAFKEEDLAQGIAWILESKDRYLKLSYRAREKAEQEFPLEKQATRYLSLFQSILGENSHLGKNQLVTN
ncbi:MAG: glycosyltransferase family 4 protein [Mastigocoleus sp.]